MAAPKASSPGRGHEATSQRAMASNSETCVGTPRLHRVMLPRGHASPIKGARGSAIFVRSGSLPGLVQRGTAPEAKTDCGCVSSTAGREKMRGRPAAWPSKLYATSFSGMCFASLRKRPANRRGLALRLVVWPSRQFPIKVDLSKCTTHDCKVPQVDRVIPGDPQVAAIGAETHPQNDTWLRGRQCGDFLERFQLQELHIFLVIVDGKQRSAWGDIEGSGRRSIVPQ